MSLQVKLLRVLQEREFQRLGSSDTVKIDVRIIAATNADLGALVRSGKFREDLFYRLNVAPVQLPPLRNRREDISLLVNHFIQKICRFEGIPEKSIPAELLEWLGTFPWPGNVRQPRERRRDGGGAQWQSTRPAVSRLLEPDHGTGRRSPASLSCRTTDWTTTRWWISSSAAFWNVPCN